MWEKQNITWYHVDAVSTSDWSEKSGGVLMMWYDIITKIDVADHDNY